MLLFPNKCNVPLSVPCAEGAVALCQLHKSIQLRMRALIVVGAAAVAVEHELAEFFCGGAIGGGGGGGAHVAEVVDALGLGVDVSGALAEAEARRQLGRVAAQAVAHQVVVGDAQGGTAINVPLIAT